MKVVEFLVNFITFRNSGGGILQIAGQIRSGDDSGDGGEKDAENGEKTRRVLISLIRRGAVEVRRKDVVSEK